MKIKEGDKLPNATVFILDKNPEEVTIRQFAEEIIDLTESKSKIIYKPLPEDDPVRRLPDISIAKNKLDWHPIYNRKKALISTIKYFKASIDFD